MSSLKQIEATFSANTEKALELENILGALEKVKGDAAGKPIMSFQAPSLPKSTSSGWDIPAPTEEHSFEPTFTLDRLSRYEHLLWRQARQIVFTLESLRRRQRAPSRSTFPFSFRRREPGALFEKFR